MATHTSLIAVDTPQQTLHHSPFNRSLVIHATCTQAAEGALLNSLHYALPLRRAPPRLQFEVVCQFIIGTFDSTETYCDDFRSIATTYLTTASGFWFDCFTSVPWSYMDFVVYQVPANFLASWCCSTAARSALNLYELH